MSSDKAAPEQQHIKISVVTTSGTWPEQDFATVPIHQKVRVALEKAAHDLKIADVSTWVARVGGRDLVLDQSWLENGVSGVVTLDYGPVESGGGSGA